MSVLYKLSKIFEGKELFSLLMTPTFLDKDLPNCVTCCFHDSLLSMNRPRNFVDSTVSIVVLLRESCPGKAEIELLKIIQCVF